MPVTLHCSTVPGASVLDLIDIAAKVGARTICAYVNAPANGQTMPGAPPKTFPVIQAGQVQDVKARLAETGTSIVNLEFFPLWPDTDVAQFRPALDRGAELGAVRIVTHVHDPDLARATETLGALSDAADAAGLAVGLEFIGMAQGCKTLDHALRLTAGVGRANCAVAVDALHFFRTSGDLAQLRSLPRERIAYAQLCDAKGLHHSLSYFPEARNRLVPGDGDLPLTEFVQALEGVAFDVEVPRNTLVEEGVSLPEHARRCVIAAEALLEAGPG